MEDKITNILVNYEQTKCDFVDAGVMVWIWGFGPRRNSIGDH